MRSTPSDTPVSVLPRIMPSIGIAYCGAYHGRMRITTKSPTAATSHELTQIETMLSARWPA
jgi:hypothetical protein